MVLWRYLTALHDRRVFDWIQGSESLGPSQWAELTANLVNNNTLCSRHMREQILDLLARYGTRRLLSMSCRTTAHFTLRPTGGDVLTKTNFL